MRPCQKEHYRLKKVAYHKKIADCNKLIEEQQKRINVFQALINQLSEMTKDDA